MSPAVQALTQTILAQAQPKSMWPNADITWPGNWPASAVCGIEYETHHRDFGNRSGGKTSVYFDTVEEYREWLMDEQRHIRNIDYAYSVSGKYYEWDWGPVLKDSFHLG